MSLVACEDERQVLTQPSGPPATPSPAPPPPNPPEPRLLNVGDELEERIETAAGRTYTFTAATSGTLVLEVSYDAFFWDVILEIQTGTIVSRPTASPWSPVVARLAVTSGQTYDLRVGIAGAGGPPTAEYKLKVSLE